ncbi:MAG: hypothetical protein R3F60_22985 [bacterium]
MDEICVTNTSRQIHTVEGTVGRAKVDAMAEHTPHPPRLRRHAGGRLLQGAHGRRAAGPGLRLRGEDAHRPPARSKALLISRCCEAGIPVVTVGGAGGRRDPRPSSAAVWR